MRQSRTFNQNLIIIFTITVISLFLLNYLWILTSSNNLGGGDFWGYWAGTFLLSTGQNPYDPEAMSIIQTTLIDPNIDFTIMAWNPPSLFVILLPLTLLSVTAAQFTWVVINLILVTATLAMLIHLYLSQGDAKLHFVYLLFGLTLPQVLQGVQLGQVTFLVSFGLVASMVLIKKNHWFWAGAILILTTIKPHIVVLPVIYLLIHITQRRKIQGWVGIFVAGTMCLFVLFILRPPLISDLIGLSKIAPTRWSTPTIGGLLGFLGITESARYLIILFFPLPFILANRQKNFSMELSIALLTLITIPTTFFGWGYDQTILLIPIAQVIHWLYKSQNKPSTISITFVIIVALGINYYQRIIGVYEVYYVWVPLFWCLIFGTTWYYTRRSAYIHE